MHNFLYIIPFLLFSCKTKQDISISQEDNNKDIKITIKKDYKNLNEENLLVTIPLKFKTYKNSKTDLRLLIIKNNDNLLHQITDYMYYSENNKPIFDIEKKTASNQDFNFYILFRDLQISRENLNKKNIDLIKNLNIRDSIVEHYYNFKSQNPMVLDELNQIGDTLILRSYSKDNLVSEKRIKINW